MQQQRGLNTTPTSNRTTAAAEQPQIKWAWSLQGGDRQISAQAAAQISASPMRDDLLEVVRLLNTVPASVQTQEPSYTASLRSVTMPDETHRTIGLQCGLAGKQTNASVQVADSDVVEGMIDVEGYNKALERDADERRDGAFYPGGNTSNQHTRHLPHCGLTVEDYPMFLGDAKALGVANRFGFLSLPTLPETELPPRRRVKFVQPIDYPHLYGNHEEQIDDELLRRIDRTHSLWVANSGFIPKY